MDRQYNAVDTVADISEDRLFIRGVDIEIGRPYAITFQLQSQDIVTDPTGRTFIPLDLTGHKLAASISRGTLDRGLVRLGSLDIEVVDGDEGIFRVVFPQEITSQFVAGVAYTFDVCWFDGTSYYYPIKGTVDAVNRSTAIDELDDVEAII